MAAVSELVTLMVDGYALQGWQQVRVSRSAEAAAISFDIVATNPAWSGEAQLLRQCKEIEIYTTADGVLGAFSGGDLLLTGYVDTYRSQVGSGRRQVTLSGRSKPADAIDCEPARHETGLVENKDLAGAAKDFDEWGLDFRTEGQLPKIPMVQRQPGETLFATLEREARRLGLLLTGQPDGSVLICKGPGPRHAGGLVEGLSPLQGWQLTDSMNLAYSEAIVRGQQSLGDDDDALRQEERAENQDYGRHRPLVLQNEGSNPSPELKTRAEWELARRNGARLSIEAEVASWRDDGGALWDPRRLIYVSLPSEDIELDLAVQAVEFSQSVGEGEGAGTMAALTLVLPETLGSSQ